MIFCMKMRAHLTPFSHLMNHLYARKYALSAGRSLLPASAYPCRREPLYLSTMTGPHHGLAAAPDVMR